MATLTITKTYEDNRTLFESSITEIFAALEKLLNTDLLDASNFVDGTLLASKINQSHLDSDYLEVDGGALQIKEDSIGPDKLALSIRQGSIGDIALFHSFNGLLSIPRGWITCDSSLPINETNYNAIHGAGAYAADGIASSALLNKYPPGFNTFGAYPKGAATTTETGSSGLSLNGDDFLDTVHYHEWYNNNDSPNQVYVIGSGWQNLSANGAGSHAAFQVSSASSGGQYAPAVMLADSGTRTFTTKTGGTDDTLSTDPIHNVFIYIMKVI